MHLPPVISVYDVILVSTAFVGVCYILFHVLSFLVNYFHCVRGSFTNAIGNAVLDALRNATPSFANLWVTHYAVYMRIYREGTTTEIAPRMHFYSSVEPNAGDVIEVSKDSCRVCWQGKFKVTKILRRSYLVVSSRITTVSIAVVVEPYDPTKEDTEDA